MQMQFESPKWTHAGGGDWVLTSDGEVVGSVSVDHDDRFVWSCTLSAGSGGSCRDADLAKAECLASYWEHRFRAVASPTFPIDEYLDGKQDLEKMCRKHFNEPVLMDDMVGRLVGYAEDDDDCYLIVDYPTRGKNSKGRCYHTCVGGYHWLDRLRGQSLVISRDGERWDSYHRVNSLLALNGAPEVAEFIKERL